MPDTSEFKKKSRLTHPTGWEPSVEWDGTKGTITAQLDNEPDPAVWEQLIADWGLDPSKTAVVDGSLQIRAWDATRDGEIVRMKYYRATIAPRQSVGDPADVERLCKLVEKHKPAKPLVEASDRALLVLLSDLQLGKGEGDGSEGTVKRVLRSLDNAVARVKELKKLGRPVDTVYIVGMGDIVENCSTDFYAMGLYSADLNRREQEKLARRLILAYVDAFVDLGLPVYLTAVPGNHGENRRNGAAFTTFDDNADLSTFESVGEILSANPDRYAHVKVNLDCIDRQDLTTTLNIHGVVCGFAHGHQFRSGSGNSINKIETWLKGQALGRQLIGDADLLFSGHFHHFLASEATGRQVFQCPAQDPGSKWFTNTTGQSAPSGLLTVVVGEGAGARGWSDLAIL